MTNVVALTIFPVSQDWGGLCQVVALDPTGLHLHIESYHELALFEVKNGWGFHFQGSRGGLRQFTHDPIRCISITVWTPISTVMTHCSMEFLWWLTSRYSVVEKVNSSNHNSPNSQCLDHYLYVFTVGSAWKIPELIFVCVIAKDLLRRFCALAQAGPTTWSPTPRCPRQGRYRAIPEL